MVNIRKVVVDLPRILLHGWNILDFLNLDRLFHFGMTGDRVGHDVIGVLGRREVATGLRLALRGLLALLLAEVALLAVLVAGPDGRVKVMIVLHWMGYI